MPRIGLKRAILFSSCVGLALSGSALLRGADAASGPATKPSLTPAEQKAFFTQKVKPILKQSCFACHANGKHKGGLSMDSRDDVMKGGEDGKVVNPDQPEQSLMIQAVEWKTADHDQYMPPAGQKPRLTEEQIKTLQEWIGMGLPWDDDSK